MNIIGHKNKYLTFSFLIIAVSIIAIIMFGFIQGVDFKGGALWQFQINESTPEKTELEDFIKNNLEVGYVQLNYDSSNNHFFFRLPEIIEEEHQAFLVEFKKQYPSFEELSLQSIGPSVGEKLRKNAIIALALALITVSLYITFVFRKTSKPVSSWKYGIVTMIT